MLTERVPLQHTTFQNVYVKKYHVIIVILSTLVLCSRLLVRSYHRYFKMAKMAYLSTRLLYLVMCFIQNIRIWRMHSKVKIYYVGYKQSDANKPACVLHLTLPIEDIINAINNNVFVWWIYKNDRFIIKVALCAIFIATFGLYLLYSSQYCHK